MPLTPEERTRLEALAGIMLPGGAGMSGASDVNLAQDPVDRVLHIEPALTARLSRFLSQVRVVRTMPDVETLAQQDPQGFKALGTVLANAYFMHEEIRRQIGYPGQEARDSSGGLTGQDLALLRPVQERGPIHR